MCSMGGWGQGEDVELGGTRQVQVFARPARQCRFSPVQVFASAGFRLSLDGGTNVGLFSLSVLEDESVKVRGCGHVGVLEL